MSISPDYTTFIDLSLYDKDTTSIVDSALTTLQARIPDWIPSSTNTEVMLLEAMAIEVSETVFNVNRLPTTMLRVLLALYGVEMNAGNPPHVNLTFTAYDTDGYTVPAGTEVSLQMANGDYLSFYTDTTVAIVATTTTATVQATATTYTVNANGIASGTSGALISPVVGVEAAVTATDVSGGADPESLDAWTQRGVQRLQRLSDTLVIPEHFTQAALENALVYRATTVDNWNADAIPATTPGDDPGHVTVVVYGTSGTLTAGQKIDLDTSLTARANANLSIHVDDPTITDVDITAAVSVNSSYVEADVLTAIETMLTDYLSPLNWPWASVVRRNELISIIDQVPGVDYVSALTVPAADVTLGTGSTLTNAGTLVITAI